ncbi:MAG TPA: prepilin-type N-terminal cleavage/methylation domain-containing protein [Dokdonella sp.]|uniref:prepilin-type N-terminal cleavage/methylation domain-containing protein n=1 Tax=Dokdonella sp. TaxID=2291710 RepID=UPI002D8080B6|nr:prepilin-type N-terminal cleavage/methylation domain-containing protein [Dokdonella sp.]HET9032429.1 prepilin-type N-terminal cleavage/methylation domain-containing protein [Dokdonella sp.]
MKRSPINLAARGFTLIEVMLSILLLAVLLAAAFGGIRSAVKGMHVGENLMDRTNRLRVAQEFIRHQLSRTLPLAFGQEHGSGKNLLFEGKRDLMRFVAPMPGYLSNGGAYVQTLEIANTRNGKQLLFNHWMLNGYDMDKLRKGDSEPVVLMDQVDSGKFEYRKLDDQGELEDWSDDWDDPGLTPVMVRIVLKMREEALVGWPEMDIPLMLDVGAARQSQSLSFGDLDRQRQERASPPTDGVRPSQ